MNKSSTYKVGDYDIYKNQKIGNGNYSNVFLGKCCDNQIIQKYKIKDGLVAVKKITISNLSYKSITKIKDEIKVMQIIKQYPHPNIVSCYDVIDDIDVIYIIMEYCQDGDLNRYLGCQLQEEKVKSYFKQIIEGMEYLYNHNIIHRDIKPKNILLTDNKKTIKICDFGLSKITNGLKRVNTICGSPLYMAPEILNNKEYNYIIDIWSLGIIVYEMLFGYHPLIECKNVEELKYFVNNNKIQIPPNNVKTDVSIECLNMLTLLLEKSQEYRIKLDQIKNHEWLTKCSYNKKNELNENENNDIFDFEY